MNRQMPKNDKIARGKNSVSISWDESLFSPVFSFVGSVTSVPKGLKPRLHHFHCRIDTMVVRKHIKMQSHIPPPKSRLWYIML